MDDCYDDGITYITSPTFPTYTSVAGYTAELREFFDQYYVTGMTTADLIEAGRPHLFDFGYPLFNDGYKDFETGIIKQFFFRQIGFDTFGIFKFRLENWMILNMPYFNKLYASVAMESQKSPLENSHRTETYTKTKTKDDVISVSTIKDFDNVGGTVTRVANNTDNHFNRDIVSNTPDTRLNLTTGEDGSGMTGIIEYASQINEHKSIDISTSGHTDTMDVHTTDAINGTTTVDATDIESFTLDTHGKLGIQSYAQLLKEYRENLMRVDKLVYKEMNELFMLLY